jgi:hypothetical protein
MKTYEVLNQRRISHKLEERQQLNLLPLSSASIRACNDRRTYLISTVVVSFLCIRISGTLISRVREAVNCFVSARQLASVAIKIFVLAAIIVENEIVCASRPIGLVVGSKSGAQWRYHCVASASDSKVIVCQEEEPLELSHTGLAVYKNV